LTARAFAAALALVLAALGCAKPPPHETTVLAKLPDRIVILPLNVTAPLPAELKNQSPEVWSALEVYLRAHGAGLKTLAYPAALGLWRASVRDVLADPKHKKETSFEDAAKLFVGKLKQHTEFDALIVPTLYVGRANLAGGKAAWDGSEQTLEFETRRGEAMEVPGDAPIEGVAPAASLHTVVFDGSGAKLHEGRAGLGLLVRARVSQSAPNDPPSYSFVPRHEPFDRVVVLRGTAKALAPYVPLLPPGQLETLSAQMTSEPAPAGAEPETAPAP
jgi:hypothetical protein